ncbi:MAG: hypothetical protein MJ016_03930 [Victivallaceae bacterium]|nr:hypothetical protein [Victivallaceae bacterium]
MNEIDTDALDREFDKLRQKMIRHVEKYEGGSTGSNMAEPLMCPPGIPPDAIPADLPEEERRRRQRLLDKLDEELKAAQ